MVNALLPCCVVEGVESAAKARPAGDGRLQKQANLLVVKNTKTGEVHRLKVPGASSAKYRPGQAVDMNLDKTAIAVTPFPINEYKRKEIRRSSWVMKTWVTVSNDGRLDGKTNIKSSEAMRGFTGGVEVVLTDRVGNILHQTQLRTYGVNGTAMGGKSERTENWKETVPPEALNKVRAVVIYHSYEPKVRLAAGVGWIRDNWKTVHKVYKCAKQVYDVATAEPEGGQSAPPPPPPPGQPTGSSTQSPSDGSLMECLEATQGLAESLGY
jgi:hypothetical protein